ncbi:MAG: hypothetical protein P8Y13_05025 [Deinococcales bacterium]
MDLGLQQPDLLEGMLHQPPHPGLQRFLSVKLEGEDLRLEHTLQPT